MSSFRSVVLTVRFLSELAMLAALAYSGAQLANGVWAWVLAIGAPDRLAIEAVIFGTAVAGLVAAGEPILVDPGSRRGDHVARQRGYCCARVKRWRCSAVIARLRWWATVLS